MKTLRTLLIFILATTFISSAAMAEGETLAKKLSKGVITLTVDIKGCDADTENFCSGLPKNSKNVFMCMMAYEHKLSTVCKLGIAEAALAMKMSAIAMDYSIQACEADADRFCRKVQPGEGRLISCIKKNKAKVSKDCISTLKETGLWEMGVK